MLCGLGEGEMRAAIYSGPGRTGTCNCGHSWEDHHLGVILNHAGDSLDAMKEAYIPEECEFFGFNEMGGKDAEGEDHCFGYRDSALPDEHN